MEDEKTKFKLQLADGTYKRAKLRPRTIYRLHLAFNIPTNVNILWEDENHDFIVLETPEDLEELIDSSKGRIVKLKIDDDDKDKMANKGGEKEEEGITDFWKIMLFVGGSVSMYIGFKYFFILVCLYWFITPKNISQNIKRLVRVWKCDGNDARNNQNTNKDNNNSNQEDKESCPPTEPEDKVKEIPLVKRLSELAGMGFTDVHKNAVFLKENDGDLELTIKSLLDDERYIVD